MARNRTILKKNTKEGIFKNLCVRQRFQKERTLLKILLMRRKELVRTTAFFEESFLNVLQIPQSELYMNCTKKTRIQSMYGLYMVQVQFKYNPCTVYIQFKFACVGPLATTA